MTSQPTLTEIRHAALRHHLNATEALLPATHAWVVDRVHHYARLAGVNPVEAFTDPATYAMATGRRVSPNCWGQADWATSSRLVYVDPVRCRTRAAAELVTAHEIGHLRWPRARHSCQFFRNVQALLSSKGPEALRDRPSAPFTSWRDREDLYRGDHNEGTAGHQVGDRVQGAHRC